MSTSRALRLVNRQLHDGVKDIMRQEARLQPDYHLDLMYLKDGSIWTTWTSTPVLSRHINTLYATFQLFDCPAELETLVNGTPNYIFQGGDSGPPFIVWILYHVLGVHLKKGPWPHDDTHDDEGTTAADGEEQQGHQGGLIIQSLVIDVSAASEPGILPLENPSHRPGSKRFSEASFFSRRTRNNEELKGQSEGIQAAAQFTAFIRDEFSSLASVNYYTGSYGEFLYDRIGTVDIRPDGDETGFINLAKFPERDYLGSSWSHERNSKHYAECIVATTKTRRKAGLPVAPLSLHLQKFLAERGVTFDNS